jgi:hypothetical protein
MLYPRYIGKNEDVFYCPDAAGNGLLSKGTEGQAARTLYPWRNFGTNQGWAYGSYEYRPRYHFPPAGEPVWVGANYEKARTARMAIAADGFSGSWDSFGPFPVHTPIQENVRMLYYNVAYMDGSAKGVRDFPKPAPGGSGREFGTRAAFAAQSKPFYVNEPREGGMGRTKVAGEFTPLRPGPENAPLPADRTEREKTIRTTDHIDRGWTFLDHR